MSLTLVAAAALLISPKTDDSVILQCDLKFMMVGADFEPSKDSLVGDAVANSKIYLNVSPKDDEMLDSLVKEKRAKIQSAPIIRTQSGQQASITLSTNQNEVPFTRSIEVTPELQKDGSVTVQMKVQETKGEEKGPHMMWQAHPTMKLGRSTYWLDDDDPDDLSQTLIVLKVTKVESK